MKHSDFQSTAPVLPGGKLREHDLDLRQLERARWERDRAALQLRLNGRGLLPHGCDQQGRYKTRSVAPHTPPGELAAQDRDESTPQGRRLGILLMLLSSVISVCVIAALATYPW